MTFYNMKYDQFKALFRVEILLLSVRTMYFQSNHHNRKVLFEFNLMALPLHVSKQKIKSQSFVIFTTNYYEMPFSDILFNKAIYFE
jgi:hypothetical protein